VLSEALFGTAVYKLETGVVVQFCLNL